MFNVQHMPMQNSMNANILWFRFGEFGPDGCTVEVEGKSACEVDGNGDGMEWVELYHTEHMQENVVCLYLENKTVTKLKSTNAVSK